ncbi:MAG: hypothetical protein TRG1_90 [Flavobacteriaceae bacterium FS1-H7996/R]|nr:MAG: hypothetical protein TRG1_90 [Flavobacteriaceae bacterium FS1-H7996/R]
MGNAQNPFQKKSKKNIQIAIKLNFLYFICNVIAEQIETCLYVRVFEI